MKKLWVVLPRQIFSFGFSVASERMVQILLEQKKDMSNWANLLILLLLPRMLIKICGFT